jgi:hypothetical protein
MDTQELYATAFGSLLVLLLGWQIAKVGDAFWRRNVQFIRKNLLQTLLVTRRAGSSDYTVGVGVAIALLLVGNIVAVCLGVESLHGLAERVRAVFHVNLVSPNLIVLEGYRIPVCCSFGVAAPELSNPGQCLGRLVESGPDIADNRTLTVYSTTGSSQVRVGATRIASA